MRLSDLHETIDRSKLDVCEIAQMPDNIRGWINPENQAYYVNDDWKCMAHQEMAVVILKALNTNERHAYNELIKRGWTTFYNYANSMTIGSPTDDALKKILRRLYQADRNTALKIIIYSIADTVPGQLTSPTEYLKYIRGT